jgi:hypothetical protein
MDILMKSQSTKSLYNLLSLHNSGDPENELSEERVEEIRKEISEIEYWEDQSAERDRDDKRDRERDER